MKKLVSLLLMVSVMLAGSISFAGGRGSWGGHGGGGHFNYGHGGWGHGYGWHGGYGWGGRGYYGGWGYGGPAAFWTGFGLTAGALALVAYNQPVVYVNDPPVVYPPQVTVMQQPAPQVIYQQQPQQVVVQQPVQQMQYAVPPSNNPEPPAYPQRDDNQQDKPDTSIDSSIFNIYLPIGNGTFTVIPLVKTATGFMGPQGEFYLDHPDIEQLKKRYLK